jgi:hypothetical protein
MIDVQLPTHDPELCSCWSSPRAEAISSSQMNRAESSNTLPD